MNQILKLVKEGEAYRATVFHGSVISGFSGSQVDGAAELPVGDRVIDTAAGQLARGDFFRLWDEVFQVTGVEGLPPFGQVTRVTGEKRTGAFRLLPFR